jgi:DNA-binding response OmpR family regulator
LDVLLVTDEDDFESVLPTLDSFAQTMRRAPLTDHVDARHDKADVAIIDARTDLTAARGICRRLRAYAPSIAVLAVVAPANFVAVDVDWNFDDVMLPAAGADELQARMRLAINRRRSALDGKLKFGDLLLHPASFTGTLAGRELGLTLTEFKLLNFLVQHAGRAFSRTRLMHEVWGYDCNGRVRTVDVHVRRLRAKLGPDYESMVDTVRGVGYMAMTPPQPEWIVSEPTLSPIRAATPPPTADSIATDSIATDSIAPDSIAQ